MAQAAKETKKINEKRGTRYGNADGCLMLMKRHLEKLHAEATPLDKT